jgi:hypothetical protein
MARYAAFAYRPNWSVKSPIRCRRRTSRRADGTTRGTGIGDAHRAIPLHVNGSLTFPEIPDVDVELIDRPTEKPWGAGEPSVAVVPSAISNAVFDAVGVRLRSVPFTPAKVLAAMQSS